MSITNVNIPTAQSFLLVDTRTGPNKVLFLPAASTLQGRYLSIKDYYGNATASTVTVSTTGLDRIDQRGIRYTLASSFGSVMLLSDGLRSWNMLGLYEGGDTATSMSGITATTVTTFSYTGAIQTYTVPANVTSVQVYMWGAGGGGRTSFYGGAGAMIQGVLTVTPGETLNIVVGGGGSTSTTTVTSAYGGGGAAGIGDGGISGGGGGRAAIQRGGTAVTNDIVVAGAGGGGTNSTRGGSATFSGTANDGASNTGVQGFGGTQSAGGAGGAAGTYGTGTAGSRGQGGSVVNPISASSNDGGGGGAGYYGGGGGGTNFGDQGGGGGGSSFTGNLSLIPGQSVLGFNSTNGYSAANTGSTYYIAGVGAGTTAVGGNGLVVIVALGTGGAAAPNLFTPTSLTNVIGFFDVNAGISQSGTALTSWTNQVSSYSSLNLTSINGSVTVGTYSSNAALKTILLSSAYIRNNGTAVAMRAFICVFNATSVSGQDSLDMIFSLWTIRNDFSYRRIQLYGGADGNDVQNGPDGQIFWNGLSGWNGSSYTFSTSPVGSWNILFVRFASAQTTGIGISDPFYSRYYNGYIGDFIFFGTSYTTTEREKAEGYLAWKWGIQANLPAGHPYKSAAPTS